MKPQSQGLQELTFLFLFFQQIPVARFLQLINDALVGIVQSLWVGEEPVNSPNPIWHLTSPFTQVPTPEAGLCTEPAPSFAPGSFEGSCLEVSWCLGTWNSQAKWYEIDDCRELRLHFP